jgi:hypothetical protein
MGMSALIEYVCSVHQPPDAVGPKVTRLDDAWAFCAGHGEDGHEWMRIRPTCREFIGDATNAQRLQAGAPA